MAPHPKHGKMNVVVVAVDDGPHSEHAFRRSVHMFPADTTHFRLVYVRPLQPEASVLPSISSSFAPFSSNPIFPPLLPFVGASSSLPTPHPATPHKADHVVGDMKAAAGFPEHSYWEQLEDVQRKQSLAVLDKFRGMAAEAGLSFTMVELQGDAREELCLYCTTSSADVLVLGSRGATFLQRLVLGSVSNYCLHHAPCPVMVDRNLDSPAPKCPVEEAPVVPAAAS